ncbi:hypothetical protein AALB39_18185 [Lachnospiraceae bacterium 54-53]
MALLDENMLPRLVRSMEPMDDLLQAEDAELSRVEAFIFELLDAAKLVTDVTVTPEYLKNAVSKIWNLECQVFEYPDELTIKLKLSLLGSDPAEPLPLIKRCNVYIPAHLKVIYEYDKKLQSAGKMFTASPRMDVIRISYPSNPVNGIAMKEIKLQAAAPSFKYVSINVPTKGESDE